MTTSIGLASRPLLAQYIGQGISISSLYQRPKVAVYFGSGSLYGACVERDCQVFVDSHRSLLSISLLVTFTGMYVKTPTEVMIGWCPFVCYLPEILLGKGKQEFKVLAEREAVYLPTCYCGDIPILIIPKQFMKDFACCAIPLLSFPL